MNEEIHNQALLLIVDMCYLMCRNLLVLMPVVLSTVRARSNIAVAVDSSGIAATYSEGSFSIKIAVQSTNY